MENIAAAVQHLQTIKKHVAWSIKAGYQGISHTTPNTSVLAWRIANKVKETQVQQKIIDRPGNNCIKAVTDLQAAGYKKFESASLAAFNKKIENSKQGNLTISETDDITPLLLSVSMSEGEDENNETSVLHDDIA